MDRAALMKKLEADFKRHLRDVGIDATDVGPELELIRELAATMSDAELRGWERELS